MNSRLATELSLLYRIEAAHKIPAAPITRQLVEWERQSLPDAIPPAPRWIEFQWPASGSVDLNAYWKGVDREQRRERLERWGGPYL